MRSILSAFLFFFLFVSQQQINAQNIWQGSDTLTTYSSEWKWFFNQSHKFVGRDSSKAFRLARAYADSAQSRPTIFQAHSNSLFGLLFLKLSENAASVKPFRIAGKQYSNAGDSSMAGYSYRNVGLAFAGQGQLDSALDYYYNSLSYLDSLKSPYFYALTTSEIARSLFALFNFDYSGKYFRNSIRLFLLDGRLKEAAASLHDYGYLLASSREEGFLPISERAARLAFQEGDSLLIGKISAVRALYYLEQNNTELAWPSLQRAQQIFRGVLADDFIFVIDGLMAEYYLQKNDVELAIFRAEEALKGITNYSLTGFNHTRTKENIYETLFTAFLLKGDAKKAAKYAKAYKEVVDRLLRESNTNKIRFLEREIESANRERQLKRTQIELQYGQERIALQNKQKIAYIIALILLTLLLISGLIGFRRVHRAKIKLQEQNNYIANQKEELELLNFNKDRLFSIIGHDLRGPIGNLSSLLTFMPNDEDSVSEESLEILDLAQQGLLESLNLLENLLVWANEQKDGANLKPKLHDLKVVTSPIEQLYAPLLAQKNIVLKNAIPKNTSAFFDRNSIKTVVRNIVSNAIKYCPSGSWIAYSVVDNGIDSLSLIIEDNGPGIPDHILDELEQMSHVKDGKLMKRLEGSLGLGLRMSRDFIESNHGKMQIVSEVNKGTKFIITLPKAQK